MKKTNLIPLLFSLVAAPMIVLPAFAGTRDAALVGPKGDVFVVYKEAGNIVTKQCAPHTIITQASNCVSAQKPVISSKSIKRTIQEKFRLCPRVNFGDFEQNKKIQLYAADYPPSRSQEALKEAKAIYQGMQEFVVAFGEANADMKKVAQAELAIRGLEMELDYDNIYAEVEAVVSSLEQSVANSSQVEPLIFSRHGQGLKFKILSAYVSTSTVCKSLSEE